MPIINFLLYNSFVSYTATASTQLVIIFVTSAFLVVTFLIRMIFSFSILLLMSCENSVDWDEHYLKLVLNYCVMCPELLCTSLIYTSTQQFRT